MGDGEAGSALGGESKAHSYAQVRLYTCWFAYDYKDDLQLRIIEEATASRGKEVGLTIECIAKVFKLLSIGIIARGKEGYNTTIAEYFVKEEEEHYTPCFGYLIYKANRPLKVMRLEALTKILTLR